MASIEVPVGSEALEATVAFVDADGNPATADDVPRWSSSDESVATVAASEDGLSASVSIGGAGAALIEVLTTNDDGTEAGAQGTVTVVADTDAAMGEIVFVAPTAPPVEEPPVEEPPVEEEPPTPTQLPA